MGLRFHKQFPLGRLLRLNLSKSGVSVGLGPKGANVNLSTRGTRATVGLPGSGLSYQKQFGPQRTKELATSPLGMIGITLLLLLALILLASS